MELAYGVKKQVGHFEHRKVCWQCTKVDSFRKSIHYYEDNREPVRAWEVRDKIHGQVLPNAIRYWNWLEQVG